MDDINFQIREMNNNEYVFLREMFYQAIFIPKGDEPLPKDIVDLPELSKYIENWGRVGDYCLVAEYEDKKIGAVWCRLFDEKNRGFGFVNKDIPEMGIAVDEPLRNKGIGSKLLDKFQILLKKTSYHALSLSVDKRNPAVNLYLRKGFKVFISNENDHIMLKELK